MANNRMQIYCKKCLAMMPIAKYYPVDWYVANNEIYSDLNKFLEKHNHCFDNDRNHDSAYGEEMFGFRTENAEDGFMSDYSKEFRLQRINK